MSLQKLKTIFNNFYINPLVCVNVHITKPLNNLNFAAKKKKLKLIHYNVMQLKSENNSNDLTFK